MYLHSAMTCHIAECLSQQCMSISGRLSSKEEHQNYDSYNLSCLLLLLQKPQNNHNLATIFTSVFSKCTCTRNVHVLVPGYQLHVDRGLCAQSAHIQLVLCSINTIQVPLNLGNLH